MALTFDKLKTIDGAASGLDADLLDGQHAANTTGAIPLSNGTVNTNLNADMLDGSHAAAFAPALADVKTAAITAVSGWSLTYLNVAKSGSYIFLSGTASKTNGVIGSNYTKFATMSAGYRPGAAVSAPASVGDVAILGMGEVYFDTNGDVEIGSLYASDVDRCTFSIFYQIA